MFGLFRLHLLLVFGTDCLTPPGRFLLHPLASGPSSFAVSGVLFQPRKIGQDPRPKDKNGIKFFGDGFAQKRVKIKNVRVGVRYPLLVRGEVISFTRIKEECKALCGRGVIQTPLIPGTNGITAVNQALTKRLIWPPHRPAGPKHPPGSS